MKQFYTESDAGSVRIGKPGLDVQIPNAMGDGFTEVLVLDKNEQDQLPKTAEFVCCVEGDAEYGGFYIYNYDCTGSTMSQGIAASLIGRFGVYVDRKREGNRVIFVRWD